MSEPTHAGIDITPFVWLLVAASAVAMIARYVRIPYALALVITGLAIGTPHLLPQAHLEPHTLFTVFLPPLLFESALNLRLNALRRNWKPIALLALGGTVASTVMVGGLATWLLKLPLPIALVFGAIISPTDPISVISVFKRRRVSRRLALLVEAESLFNDGVAVVLFTVLLEAATSGGGLSALAAARQFFIVVVGGAGVGFTIGLLMSRITRYFDDHLLEIMLTTIVAFGSFLCAEAAHVSGVIAVVAAGLVIGNYGMEIGMSPTTRLAVSSFWEYLAFAANSIVFLLVGLEITYLDLWSQAGPIAVAVFLVLLSRAVSVYALAPVGNLLGARLSPRCQHVFVWGGLRGALSMALALGLSMSFPHRNFLVALTFGVVLFSLLVQGLSLESMLRALRLTEPRKEAEYQRLAGELLGVRAALEEVQRLRNHGLAAPQVCGPVEQDLQNQLARLSGEIDQLHMSNEALFRQQVTEVRRRALLAEKSALQASAREGVVASEDLRSLEERINAQLADIECRSE